MINSSDPLVLTLSVIFIVTQLLWTASLLNDVYIFRLPVNRVDMREEKDLDTANLPYIILFYPVLRELEQTMRTTFTAISCLRYPRARYRIIAIPNRDDFETVASLQRLKLEFNFLEVLEVPPTSDPSWNVVWSAWDRNPHVYWWHKGPRAHSRDLPPKKTRQLIYAFYTIAEQQRGGEDFLVNYIDADSCPPVNHFMAAAVGIRHFDVLQASNIAGNLNDTLAASWHAFDHMAWDGRKFAHLTADGKQPYWMLGKGLFYKASDLSELGGFHPWITIEDPEIGERLWKNGRRLGYIDEPLIEEVPRTIGHGIRQKKRWVAGFFQSLDGPLDALRYTPLEKFKAWLIFLPCLSFAIGPVGIPIGVWAFITMLKGDSPLPAWSIALSVMNVAGFTLAQILVYRSAWRRSAIVLERKRDRLRYLVRCNPLALTIYGLIWVIPLWIGWRMYRNDGGLVWERTEKVNANAGLIRRKFVRWHRR